ncbi:MAG: dienelactone hydrolase family protein, partial [Caulobacter sp.]|nr:dienelactone hydrolase family protein [Caulobacter sp.]
AEASVLETDVTFEVAGLPCDGALFTPAGKGTWPGAVIIPDALGLRPVFRDMGRRLAASGHVVLVPNPYYRSQKAPLITGEFDFSNPADRQKLAAPRALLTPDNVTTDCLAFMAFLDGRKVVSKKARIGFSGYCMGGAIVMRAAAARPDRVGAAASYHGGGLATAQPDSPHLLVPKIKAALYFGIAADDDAKQPDAKTLLKDAFESAGGDAKIEVYAGARHGWCVKGSAAYDEASAERAWAELLALYRRALL